MTYRIDLKDKQDRPIVSFLRYFPTESGVREFIRWTSAFWRAHYAEYCPIRRVSGKWKMGKWKTVANY